MNWLLAQPPVAGGNCCRSVFAAHPLQNSPRYEGNCREVIQLTRVDRCTRRAEITHELSPFTSEIMTFAQQSFVVQGGRVFRLCGETLSVNDESGLWFVSGRRKHGSSHAPTILLRTVS